jgi:DNA (cytosine-5)-methyltransferase 1
MSIKDKYRELLRKRITGKYTAADLFSGCGGLTEGLKQAGFQVLFAIEVNHECCETYRWNHREVVLIERDIHKVDEEDVLDMLKDTFDVETVDLLAGGPPCEGFSIAGLRDPDDPRNRLFEEFMRFLKALRPKWFIIENVPGLISMERGKVLERVLKEIREAGYSVCYKILNAADYGVPQIRERVFIVGTNTGCPITFPSPTHAPLHQGQVALGDSLKPYVTVWEAISDLPPLEPGEEKNEYATPPQNDYQRLMREGAGSQGLRNHRAVRHREYMVERFKLIPQGGNMKDLPPIPKVRPRKIYAARCRRLRADAPSYTVTAHCLDELIHPFQHRAITPREAARLQSFPDRYVFFGPLAKFHSDPRQDQYEQIGDAVPPLLARAIALEIAKHLDSMEARTPVVEAR